MAVLDGISGLTSAWSRSRVLLSAYGGSLEDLSGSSILRIYDQSGATINKWETTAGNVTIATQGPASRAAATFNGANTQMNAQTSGSVNLALSDMIANNAYYFIISLIVSTYTTNAANSFDNQSAWGDNSGYFGLNFKSTGPTALIFNYDGSDDHADVTAEATGTVMTLECRHESGNIYIRKNAGSWSGATASGNTQVLTDVVRLGRGYNGAPTTAEFFSGYLFEGACFNVVPSSGDMDTIAANFYSWVTSAGKPWNAYAQQ